MLTKDMTRAPGQTESFLLSWTCSYQNPFRLCLPSCVSAPLSQTRLLWLGRPLNPQPWMELEICRSSLFPWAVSSKDGLASAFFVGLPFDFLVAC